MMKVCREKVLLQFALTQPRRGMGGTPAVLAVTLCSGH